jgi:SAM-dependent methyltransferase
MISKTTWTQFGKNDPYYGVLSDEKYRVDTLTDAKIEEFFETGKAFVATTQERIKSQFGTGLYDASILDFGCGVGRLAIPFSQITSGEVLGIDVSPDILQIAKAHAKVYEASNIKFIVYDGKTLPSTAQFDLINSYIVLQHIEKSIGMNLLKQLLERVKIGGLFQVQVTHDHSLSNLKAMHYHLRSNFGSYNALYCILKYRSLQIEPFMQMNRYDPRELMKLMAQYSPSVHVEFTDHGGFLGASYLLRRAF